MIIYSLSTLVNRFGCERDFTQLMPHKTQIIIHFPLRRQPSHFTIVSLRIRPTQVILDIPQCLPCFRQPSADSKFPLAPPRNLFHSRSGWKRRVRKRRSRSRTGAGAEAAEPPWCKPLRNGLRVETPAALAAVFTVRSFFCARASDSPRPQHHAFHEASARVPLQRMPRSRGRW